MNCTIALAAVIVSGCVFSQSLEGPALEDSVAKVLMGVTDDLGDPWDLLQELDKLGPRSKIGPIVLMLLKKGRESDSTISPRQVALGARALGLLKEPSAMPSLKELVLDSKATYFQRRMATEAIGKIDAEQGKKELLHVFDNSDDNEWNLRLTAAEALSEVKDRSILNHIEQYSRGETNPRRRQRYEKVVGKMRQRLETQ